MNKKDKASFGFYYLLSLLLTAGHAAPPPRARAQNDAPRSFRPERPARKPTRARPVTNNRYR